MEGTAQTDTTIAPRTARWPVLAKGLLVVAAVLVVVLVVTGVVLSNEYQPTKAEARSAVATANANAGDSDQMVRTLHRWASNLLLPVAIVLGVLTWSLAARRRWEPALGLVLAVLGADWRGRLLGWERLVFHKNGSKLDRDVSGVWQAAFDDSIRYVIVDGSEVSQASYQWAMISHLVVAAAVAAAVVIIARGLPRAADDV